jgi:hypothetical protein
MYYRMMHRASALALLLLAGCGGGGGAAAGAGGAAGASAGGAGPSSGAAASEPAAAPAPEACPGAYREYVRAWAVWFYTELEDPETSKAVTEEFVKELPSRSALADMRMVAEELRYEPGFDFWFVALTATERAIDACGESAPAPATAARALAVEGEQPG